MKLITNKGDKVDLVTEHGRQRAKVTRPPTGKRGPTAMVGLKVTSKGHYSGNVDAATINLEHLDIEVQPVSSDRPLAVADVWEIGNTIEWTSRGTLNGDEIHVGCKAVSFRSATGALRGMTRTDNGWNFTFRATIGDDNQISYGIGGRITESDLRNYASDFKLVEKAPEPEPEQAVMITLREAQALVAIRGRIGGKPEGWRGAAESGLRKIMEAHDIPDYSGSPAYRDLNGSVRFTD